jgi:hypothetical protein
MGGGALIGCPFNMIGKYDESFAWNVGALWVGSIWYKSIEYRWKGLSRILTSDGPNKTPYKNFSCDVSKQNGASEGLFPPDDYLFLKSILFLIF